MRIPLKDIKTASQCFKYYHFVKQAQEKPVNANVSIVEKVMQKCYTKAMNTGFKAEWRQIVGWVDKLVFASVDMSNDEHFKTAKLQSEHILLFLQRWYKEHYLKDTGIGYINIPLEVPITHKHIVYDKAAIVTLEDIPNLVVVDNTPRTNPELRKDIYINGLAWLFSKNLDIDMMQISHYSIKIKGGFTHATIKLYKENFLKIEDTINQIAQMIGLGIDFPSYTEQCASCPFLKGCKLC